MPMPNSRDDAFRLLADALIYLAEHRQPGDEPSVRLSAIPLRPSGADYEAGITADLTPELADLISGGIFELDATNRQTREDVPVGDWSAAGTTKRHPFLTADIEDYFAAEVDYQAVFNDVLDQAHVSRDEAVRALDDVLGDIPAPAPFNDEDGDA